MKKFLFAVLALALVGFLVWKFVFSGKKNDTGSGPKPQALVVSKHSAEFNNSFNTLLEKYYGLTEAFVQWDTAAVTAAARELTTAVEALKLTEMEKDTAIYPTVQIQWDGIKAEVSGLMNEPTLGEKRASLNMLSQQLFDLLRIVKYDAAKVYFQECPMALNNYEMAANWLSATDSLRNPYLGLKDPKYGKEMLSCGSTREVIDYVEADSTKTE